MYLKLKEEIEKRGCVAAVPQLLLLLLPSSQKIIVSLSQLVTSK